MIPTPPRRALSRSVKNARRARPCARLTVGSRVGGVCRLLNSRQVWITGMTLVSVTMCMVAVVVLRNAGHSEQTSSVVAMVNGATAPLAEHNPPGDAGQETLPEGQDNTMPGGQDGLSAEKNDSSKPEQTTSLAPAAAETPNEQDQPSTKPSVSASSAAKEASPSSPPTTGSTAKAQLNPSTSPSQSSTADSKENSHTAASVSRSNVATHEVHTTGSGVRSQLTDGVLRSKLRSTSTPLSASEKNQSVASLRLVDDAQSTQWYEGQRMRLDYEVALSLGPTANRSGHWTTVTYGWGLGGSRDEVAFPAHSWSLGVSDGQWFFNGASRQRHNRFSHETLMDYHDNQTWKISLEVVWSPERHSSLVSLSINGRTVIDKESVPTLRSDNWNGVQTYVGLLAEQERHSSPATHQRTATFSQLVLRRS